MPEKSYRIIYKGKVAQGRGIGEVKRNLTSIFKLGPEKVEQLFSGKPVIIAKDAGYESAMKYKMAFETAGAICRVEEVQSELRPAQPPETDRHETSKSDKPWIITCPRCGFEQEETEECRQCGIIINKYSGKKRDTPQVAPHEASPLYFAVSKPKLILMSLCTFGIYEIYWFYKNWQLIKKKTGQNIRPFWRAIFAIFFCHSLFKSVQDSVNSHGLQSGISPGWLTFGYIALSVLWKLPDPFWLISLLTFLPLLPVQGVINDINTKSAPHAERNDRFSGKNIAVIILGAIWFMLALIGTLIPE